VKEGTAARSWGAKPWGVEGLSTRRRPGAPKGVSAGGQNRQHVEALDISFAMPAHNTTLIAAAVPSAIAADALGFGLVHLLGLVQVWDRI